MVTDFEQEETTFSRSWQLSEIFVPKTIHFCVTKQQVQSRVFAPIHVIVSIVRQSLFLQTKGLNIYLHKRTVFVYPLQSQPASHCHAALQFIHNHQTICFSVWQRVLWLLLLITKLLNITLNLLYPVLISAAMLSDHHPLLLIRLPMKYKIPATFSGPPSYLRKSISHRFLKFTALVHLS